jgi:hypothetical protein
MRIRVSPGALVPVVFTVAVLAVGGCGLAPKGPIRDPNARPPSPSGPDSPTEPPITRPPLLPTETPTSSPSSSGFSGLVAVACNGKPTGQQVVDVVRRAGALRADARPTVKRGPLCAGTWQFTELTVPGLDPMDVVTRGAPNALTLVTAGTDPCTPKVRVEAPQGIKAVLGCEA